MDDNKKIQQELQEIFKGESVLDMMTEEEILYYATPAYDEIQAEKEARASKLE